MKMSPKQICERFHKIKGERSTWEQHWQELADYTIPRKNEIVNKNGTKGEKKGAQLFDNTALVSAELLAGALHGLLTNPNTYWFELSTGDDELDKEDDVREYLQMLSHKVHGYLNASNFQTEVHELYLDLVTFGTANMTVEEDDELIFTFSAKHISEVYISEDSKGRVSEVYREFEWDARQIVQEFCEGVTDTDYAALEPLVGKKVVAALKKGDNTKFTVIHAVYLDSLTEKKTFPFCSQYVLEAEKLTLREGGFRRNPYLTPRWTKVSNEVYGRSPAMNALPECKTVNAMVKALIKGAQKMVDPPVQMPDDGAIRPLRVIPGGVNYYRAGSNDRIEPIFNDSRIDIGAELMRDRQIRIREAFFVDQLQLQQGPQMTATEVNQRTEERMRLLGPMLGRQQAEFLRPLIERVFEILERRNLIPKPPEILSERDITVRYSSTIAKAQRMNEAQDLLRAFSAATPFIQMDPASMDNISADDALKEIWRTYGASQSVLRSRQEVEDMREQRAEAQQAAMQRQAEIDQADKVQKTGPTLVKAQEQGA